MADLFDSEPPKARRDPILSAEVITVQADATEKRCTSCDVLCYWGETKRGKRTLVDCRHHPLVPGLEPPRPPVRNHYAANGPGSEGRGVSHFYTCPNAAQHSTKGEKGRPANG
jgi:hypothetical protein